MKDYKTTIGGILLAVGAVMTQVTDPSWIGTVGASMLALGGLIAGTQAGDKKKGGE